MAPLIDDVASEGGRALHLGNRRFAIPRAANIVVCAPCRRDSRNGTRNGRAIDFEKE